MTKPTEIELDVIEAAVDLANWHRALDCGCPAQKHIAEAELYLFDRVSELENEHDGRWTRPKLSDGTKVYRSAIQQAMKP